MTVTTTGTPIGTASVIATTTTPTTTARAAFMMNHISCSSDTVEDWSIVGRRRIHSIFSKERETCFVEKKLFSSKKDSISSSLAQFGGGSVVAAVNSGTRYPWFASHQWHNGTISTNYNIERKKLEDQRSILNKLAVSSKFSNPRAVVVAQW